MKLNEIVLSQPIIQQSLNYNDLKLETKEHYFDIDNNPVFIVETKEQDVYALLLYINEDIASYLIYKELNINNIESLYTILAVTYPKFRGQGLAWKLLYNLYKYTNKQIISDEQLTRDGIKLWAKLATILPIKIWDTIDEISYKYGEVPVEELITLFNDGENRYLFIIPSSRGIRQHIEEYIKPFNRPNAYYLFEDEKLM